MEPGVKGTAVMVDLKGLHGGHSGCDVHKEYANANKILSRLMVMREGCLLALQGGTGPSAVAREASCMVVLPGKESAGEDYTTSLRNDFAEIQRELSSVGPPW